MYIPQPLLVSPIQESITIASSAAHVATDDNEPIKIIIKKTKKLFANVLDSSVNWTSNDSDYSSFTSNQTSKPTEFGSNINNNQKNLEYVPYITKTIHQLTKSKVMPKTGVYSWFENVWERLSELL